jgi:secernin
VARSCQDPLSRRTLLGRGAAAAGGLLGLLSGGGLSALADSRSGVRSPREVNRLAWPMSCDTMVALPDATTTGTTILGKNSDRPVFDCQPLVRYPAARHASGTMLQLEYRSIPQPPRTHATIGSSPYWCWGYEEGINEFGVAIGNEAIFTKTFSEAVAQSKAGQPPEKGLLGMDLLRLGLERGTTARKALDVITDLVERYGQWGSGVPGMDHETGGYDNSYIIADGKEAWILETVGTRFVARKVTSGVATISNQPSIRNRWDLASHDLVDYAVDRGWWPREQKNDFDFARAYIDLKTPLQLSQLRVQRSRQLLCQKEHGDISPRWVMRVLRDHFEGTFLGGPNFNAALPDFLTLCMHSSPAGFTWGNTASSAVFLLPDLLSEKTDRLPQMWWTPVTPCTGLYIPVFAEGGKLPDVLTRAGGQGKTVTAPVQVQPDTFAETSYWWQFRDLLDRVKGDETGTRFRQRQPVVRKAFDRLERRWLEQSATIQRTAIARRKAGSATEATRGLDEFTDSCVATALETTEMLKREMKV